MTTMMNQFGSNLLSEVRIDSIEPEPEPEPEQEPAHELGVSVSLEKMDQLIRDSIILPSYDIQEIKQKYHYLVSNYRDKPVAFRSQFKIYLYDGTNFLNSPIGESNRFLNMVDIEEGAVNIKDVFVKAGIMSQDQSLGVANSGMEIENIIKIELVVLSSSGNGYFDTTVKSDEYTLDFTHRNVRQIGTHSGDENIRIADNSYLKHTIVINTHLESGDYIVTFVGYNSKQLKTFTSQTNLFKLTMSDNTIKYITGAWDFTPHTINDALVAGLAVISKNNITSNISLKFHFKSYTQREFKFDTTHLNTEYYRSYLRINESINTITQLTDTDSNDYVIDYTHVPKSTTNLIGCEEADIPESLQSLVSEKTLLSPGIFGGNTGLANLGYKGSTLVAGDSPVIIYLKKLEVNQTFKTLCNSRRCILIFEVIGDDVSDVCLYTCHLMTPQSTIIRYDPITEKYYHIFGTCISKNEDDSIDIELLWKFHLENEFNFPLISDRKIYTYDHTSISSEELISNLGQYLQYLDQLQMCISPTEWLKIFKQIIEKLNDKKKKLRKLMSSVSFNLLDDKITASDKGQQLIKEKADYDKELKELKQFAQYIMKFRIHILASKSFGTSQKLSGDIQGELRKAATMDLKNRVSNMLKDPERFIEDIYELFENLSPNEEYIVLGDTRLLPYDGSAIGCCIEHGKKQDMTLVLPNKGSQRFTPIPITVEKGNLIDMYEAGHNLYLYLALLASRFCVGNLQSPFDEEPLTKLVKFLFEAHTSIVASLSSSYKPDKENLTTNVLDTLQYLVCAIWSGFRAGQFNPELARYGNIVPKGMIPKSRESINDYDVQTLMQYSLMLKYTDNKDLISSFWIRLVGDVCRTIWVKFIQPYNDVLKKEKKQKELVANQDKTKEINTILRYQFWLILKILYPMADMQKISIVLFDQEQPLYIDIKRSKTCKIVSTQKKAHHWATRELEYILEIIEDGTKLIYPSKKMDHLLQIVATRFYKLFIFSNIRMKENGRHLKINKNDPEKKWYPWDKSKIVKWLTINDEGEEYTDSNDILEKIRQVMVVRYIKYEKFKGLQNYYKYYPQAPDSECHLFQKETSNSDREYQIDKNEIIKILKEAYFLHKNGKTELRMTDSDGMPSPTEPNTDLEPEPEPETAIVLTPKQELEQFGLTEEMSSKYLQVISDISTYIPELKKMCEIDIFKQNIVMITKIIFKYWDDPDKGVREVLRYVKLYD